jgi:exopolyphosphatase/guanosine-5'-triphosphate,3'-diphosphate pyrophosphatase
MTDSVIAAIDVGTNSVHMVIAKVSEVGFTVITTEKINVRLGEGSNGLDHLAPEAIERGLNALIHMKRVATAHNAVIRAVATSAVREAVNSDDFLRKVK